MREKWHKTTARDLHDIASVMQTRTAWRVLPTNEQLDAFRQLHITLSKGFSPIMSIEKVSDNQYKLRIPGPEVYYVGYRGSLGYVELVVDGDFPVEIQLLFGNGGE